MNHPAGEFASHDAYKSFQSLIMLLWAFVYPKYLIITLPNWYMLLLDSRYALSVRYWSVCNQTAV